MQFSDRQVGNALILKASGRIDHASTDTFRTALQPHLDRSRESTVLVMDMSGVEYISSVGLRVLMLAAKQVRIQGGAIAVAALQPVVREIFQISRFYLVIPSYDDVPRALAELSPAALAAYGAS